MKRLFLLLTVAAFVLLVAVPAWAKEPAQPELSLNEAIAQALKNSEAIKKADKEVDRTDALRDQELKDLGYIPTAAAGEAAGETAFASLLSANLTWEMSEKSLTAAQDSLVLNACNKYWGIQQAIGAVEVAKQSLKQAELDLKKARVSLHVGLISTDALLGAETKQVGAKSALDKAQNDLETSYTAFNQLVGLWPEDKPVLTDELGFTPMSDATNLDHLVAKVLESSPSVWLADKKVEQQKTLQDLLFYTGSYQPYEVRKITMDQVKLDAVSAKEATEILTRNMYYTVRTLEANYPAAEQAVKLAEENLRVVQLKFQVGLVTQADMAASETALAQARQSLLELKKNHAYYALAIEKPWAA